MLFTQIQILLHIENKISWLIFETNILFLFPGGGGYCWVGVGRVFLSSGLILGPETRLQTSEHTHFHPPPFTGFHVGFRVDPQFSDCGWHHEVRFSTRWIISLGPECNFYHDQLLKGTDIPGGIYLKKKKHFIGIDSVDFGLFVFIEMLVIEGGTKAKQFRKGSGIRKVVKGLSEC